MTLPAAVPACSTPQQAAEAALTRARATLVMEHPFFGSLALRLRFRADPTCADFWADGRTLGFNPIFTAALSPGALVGALAHEVLHLAFGHHVRRKGREQSLWNRACDFAVNQVLLDAGFTLPQGFAHNPAYVGMNADEIYDILTASLQENPANGSARDLRAARETAQAGGADGMAFPGGSPTDRQAHPQLPPGRELPKGETTTADAAGNRAAARPGTGKTQPGGDAAAFTGEVRDHPDARDFREDAARKGAEQEADIAVTQALQRARHMGNLPAGLTRLLRKARQPQLDWRSLLRQFLEACARSDYTWTTPNRRYLHRNMYLPSRRENCLEQVALAVDCSGSVDEKALAMFCAELSTVLDAYDTTLTVLFHDTKVQKACTFSRMDMPWSLAPVGGGGTDFRPVCRHIEEEHLHPACLVWFTDLECDRYPEEPEYPVLWVCSAADAQPPPFGRVISLCPPGAGA